MTAAQIAGIAVTLAGLGLAAIAWTFGGDRIDHGINDPDATFSPDTEAAIAQALTVANRPAVALAVVHQLRQREQGR